MLHVKIPLHYVIALGIVFNEAIFKGGVGFRKDYRERPSGECPSQLARICRAPEFVEWRSPAVQRDRCIEHGKHIEHSEASTHGGLAVSEGGPSKPDSRLEVAERGI